MKAGSIRTSTTHVTFKSIRSGGSYRDKMMKVPLWKKKQIQQSDTDQFPTRTGTSAIEHQSLFPEDSSEQYQNIEDIPSQTFRLPREPVMCFVIA